MKLEDMVIKIAEPEYTPITSFEHNGENLDVTEFNILCENVAIGSLITSTMCFYLFKKVKELMEEIKELKK